MTKLTFTNIFFVFDEKRIKEKNNKEKKSQKIRKKMWKFSGKTRKKIEFFRKNLFLSFYNSEIIEVIYVKYRD